MVTIDKATIDKATIDNAATDNDLDLLHAASTQTQLLTAKGLIKDYGGLKAINNINFTLYEGETRALIGPNGSGKSTLIGLLSGRIEATKGTVIFQCEDISKSPAHQRIAKGMAYTFQITSIFDNLSIYENVALAIRRHSNEPEKYIAKKVHLALDQVGLDVEFSILASTLSYGHKRLLEIAMGLAQNSRLLILDEPTQGLADHEITRFKKLIRDISASTTILLIEHNMDVVMELADQITVLNRGEILAEGTPEDIRNNAEVQAAYLGQI